ncbi:transferase [Syncephalis plumigaleata]|nr:transferase [Syncephalis plumigaleata]
MTIDYTEVWITPEDDTSNQQTYQLSHTDYLVPPSCPQRFLFYKNHNNVTDFMPTDVLIKALRNTLKHYPMLYGRLVFSENGEYEVQPSSRGIRFIEAFSKDDISIYEPHWPQDSFPPEWQAIADYPSDEPPLFAVKLTRFANNSGLVLTVGCDHYMADEEGFVLLLKTWAALVRGETPPLPSHDRHLLRLSSMPKGPSEKHLPAIVEQLHYGNRLEDGRVLTLYFSPEKLAHLKKTAIELIDPSERATEWFSTLDVILMLVWRATIKARQLPETHLLIKGATVNMRSCLPDLPENYFGNTVAFSRFPMTVKDVLSQDIGKLSALHRKSINAVKSEEKSVWIDKAEIDKEKPLLERLVNWLSHLDLLSSDWSKFDCSSIDFGAGRPVRYRCYIYPLRVLALIHSVPSSDNDKPGLEVCLTIEKQHYDRFVNDKELMVYVTFLG